MRIKAHDKDNRRILPERELRYGMVYKAVNNKPPMENQIEKAVIESALCCRMLLWHLISQIHDETNEILWINKE